MVTAARQNVLEKERLGLFTLPSALCAHTVWLWLDPPSCSSHIPCFFYGDGTKPKKSAFYTMETENAKL